MSFPCTRCGACCMNVGHVLPLLALGWVGDDGVCIQYDRDTKGCRMYDQRPIVCRIDEGRPAEFTSEEWEAGNLKACDVLHRMVYGTEREASGTCAHKEL